MTVELTKLAEELEAEMKQMLADEMTRDAVWGWCAGVRDGLKRAGQLGELEDEALGRHFDRFFGNLRESKVVPLIAADRSGRPDPN
jgi:hypothetical protein